MRRSLAITVFTLALVTPLILTTADAIPPTCRGGGRWRCPIPSPSVSPSPSPSPSPPSSACVGVPVSPSTGLQGPIDANPSGTTFCLADGTYNLTAQVRPKSGDRFIAVNRRLAILDGRGGAFRAIYGGDGVSAVVLQGLVIRSFNPPVSGGNAVVKFSVQSQIIDTEIGPSTGTCVFHEADTLIQDSRIHDCGATGVGAYLADRSQILDSEFDRNGADGGGKWLDSDDMVFRGNNFHHNFNNGLWLDFANERTLVEDNVASDNASYGIYDEVNCSVVIRNNVAERNGRSGLIMTATQSEIYGNTFTGNGESGIMIWDQTRQNADCPLPDGRGLDSYLHDNTVTGNRLVDVAQFQASGTPRLSFVSNHYSSASVAPFRYLGSDRTWAQWQALGFDLTGSMN